MQRYTEFKKRIMIYKDRKIIIWGSGINGKRIQQVLSMAKINVAYFVDSRQNSDVFSPNRLLAEDKNESLVIVSPHYIPYIMEIDRQLEEWGWIENRNYINVVTNDIIRANQNEVYFDPFLGFAQIWNIEGFATYGDIQNKRKFVLLGNCTSLPNKNKRDNLWTNILTQNILEEYSLYNGACAGYSSSQELLKMIRDVLVLNPEVILVFNGVIDATDVNRKLNLPYYTKFEYNLLEKCFASKEEMKYKDMQTISNKVLYGQVNNEKNWEHYIRNVRIMHAISAELNIKFFCFLQPCLYYNGAGLSPEDKEIYDYIYNKEERDIVAVNAFDFYRKVCSFLKNEDWFYDMTGIFEGLNQSMYLDEIHYTKLGNQVIGNYILEVLRNNKIQVG